MIEEETEEGEFSEQQQLSASLTICHKKRKKMKRPSFEWKVENIKNPLSLRELSDVVQSALAASHPSANKHRLTWNNKTSIRRVIAIHVPALDPYTLLPSSTTSDWTDFEPPKTIIYNLQNDPNFLINEHMPKTVKIFGQGVLTKGSGQKGYVNSSFAAFNTVSIPKNQKPKSNILSPLNSMDLEFYLLKKEEMIEHNYPLCIPAATNDSHVWKSTVECPTGSEYYNYIAVDCEMCLTKEGLELARISLVDGNGTVILDSLVQPTNPILDYNTRFSGITPAMLSNISTSLSQIQTSFMQIVYAETILVGHSLENDLNVLKITHERCIDTALLYSHTRGPSFKPSLKWLASKYLGRVIQDGLCNSIEGNGGGHDSVQDAQTCVELLKLKLKNGPSFGRLHDDSETLTEFLKRYDRSAEIIDRTIDESAMLEKIQKSEADFVYATISSLELAYDYGHASNENIHPALHHVDDIIGQIYENISGNSLMLVFSGNRWMRPFLDLLAKKNEMGKGAMSGWTEAHQLDLEREAYRTRMGLAFLKIKPDE